MAEEAPFSQAPTIAVSGAQKPSLTVRQFGTTTKTAPPSSSSAALVLLVAGGALAIGLVAGFVMLSRNKPPQSGPLEFPTTPTVAMPSPPVSKKAEPTAEPVNSSEVAPDPLADTADAALDPRGKRDVGSRRDNSGKPAASASGTPVDDNRRDGGWKKPAWAMPDEDPPPKAPAPSAAPPPAAPPQPAPAP